MFFVLYYLASRLFTVCFTLCSPYTDWRISICWPLLRLHLYSPDGEARWRINRRSKTYLWMRMKITISHHSELIFDNGLFNTEIFKGAVSTSGKTLLFVESIPITKMAKQKIVSKTSPLDHKHHYFMPLTYDQKRYTQRYGQSHSRIIIISETPLQHNLNQEKEWERIN